MVQVSIDPASATDFSLDMDDGQPPLVFASKERNVFYATYHAFVNRVVASKSFEERQQLLFAELRKAGGGYTTRAPPHITHDARTHAHDTRHTTRMARDMTHDTTHTARHKLTQLKWPDMTRKRCKPTELIWCRRCFVWAVRCQSTSGRADGR
jgi:hypothetical protein